MNLTRLPIIVVEIIQIGQTKNRPKRIMVGHQMVPFDGCSMEKQKHNCFLRTSPKLSAFMLLARFA